MLGLELIRIGLGLGPDSSMVPVQVEGGIRGDVRSMETALDEPTTGIRNVKLSLAQY